MPYDEFKNLCKKSWKEKYNHLGVNRLEDKIGMKNIGFVMNPKKNTKSLIQQQIFFRLKSL